MVFATLLTTVLLAFAVAANPIVKRSFPTLSMSKRINVTSVNIVEHDQLRAKALRAKGEARAAGTLHSDLNNSIPVINEAVSYVASVGVGSPATQCKRL
jgi:cathepsin E